MENRANSTNNPSFGDKKEKWGTFYCVGTGPGDPELLTLKGLRLLQSVPVVFVPRQTGSGRTRALEIVRQYLDETRQTLVPLDFPMVRAESEENQQTLETAWDQATGLIGGILGTGLAGVFPVLGDPLLYGTFNYLLERLQARFPDIPLEVVPGITAMQAASALSLTPLAEGNEQVVISPVMYSSNPQEVGLLLEIFDTVVLLKAGGTLEKLLPLLEEKGYLEHSVYVEQAGMEGQRVIRGEAIQELRGQKLSYFSLLLIKKH